MRLASALRSALPGLLLAVALIGSVGRTALAADRAALEEAARSGDPSTAADALFHLAEIEDAAGDYGPAMRHYREAVQRQPSLRYAAKAMTRAAILAAHGEDDWKPFARLEKVRNDPKLGDDPVAIEALSRDADGFPPGPSRPEAWMVCAGAYLGRLNRRKDAEAELRKVIADANTEPLTRRVAASQLVNALAADGDFAEARATAHSLGNALDAREALHIEVLARRHLLHVAALADLALFAASLATVFLAAARRGALGDIGRAARRVAPLAVGFAAYVALAGGFIASQYETGNSAPFLAFGATTPPMMIAARIWSSVGSRSPLARVARATLCMSAILAVAFLVLESINSQYLEGFGL